MSAEATPTSLSRFGRPLAATCNAGGCPTVYPDEASDSVIIQGYLVEGTVDLPSGESLIRVPRQLIRDAVQAMSS